MGRFIEMDLYDLHKFVDYTKLQIVMKESHYCLINLLDLKSKNIYFRLE